MWVTMIWKGCHIDFEKAYAYACATATQMGLAICMTITVDPQHRVCSMLAWLTMGAEDVTLHPVKASLKMQQGCLNLRLTCHCTVAAHKLCEPLMLVNSSLKKPEEDQNQCVVAAGPDGIDI